MSAVRNFERQEGVSHLERCLLPQGSAHPASPHAWLIGATEHARGSMFIISEIEDKIRVDPGDLGRPVLDAVISVIEHLYIDKACHRNLLASIINGCSKGVTKSADNSFLQVLHDLGLVVTIYDVLSITGGYIYPSDGAAHYTVAFRLVVFRPFVGQILTGRLAKSDKYVYLPSVPCVSASDSDQDMLCSVLHCSAS